MTLTKERKEELIHKFMDMLIEDGGGEEMFSLVGAFSTALQCVIDPELMDKLVEIGRRRREKEKA